MNDSLVLVDVFDNVIGQTDKETAHRNPLLHRAFSVFLYDDTGKNTLLLLQKRAQNKYHSGGLWTNTCCSHPRMGENLLEAAVRRLQQEMGITCHQLLEINSFIYYHQFHSSLYEYELDNVLVGQYNGRYKLNPLEAEEACWIEDDILAKDLLNNPQAYAPWFRIAAPMVLQWLKRA